VLEGSLRSGEKWQTQLFTDTQVGKATPAKVENLIGIWIDARAPNHV
jgi:hypothetical protein